MKINWMRFAAPPRFYMLTGQMLPWLWLLSALLAWMWLGEAVGPLEWFGGALVLFGLAAGTGAIKWTQFLPRSAHAAALRTRTPD